MYSDCMQTIDIVYDVASNDTTRDGKATAFEEFQATCLNINSTTLTNRIKSLQARHCVVPTAGIVGEIVATVQPKGCKDDDAGMMALIAQTCEQVLPPRGRHDDVLHQIIDVRLVS